MAKFKLTAANGTVYGKDWDDTLKVSIYDLATKAKAHIPARNIVSIVAAGLTTANGPTPKVDVQTEAVRIALSKLDVPEQHKIYRWLYSCGHRIYGS